MLERSSDRNGWSPDTGDTAAPELAEVRRRPRSGTLVRGMGSSVTTERLTNACGLAQPNRRSPR